MKKSEVYFAKIKDDLIRCKDVNRKLLLTYIYLDRRKTIENNVGFSLYDLVLSCGYKIDRTESGAIIGFKRSLNFLADNGMIYVQDFAKLRGNNYLTIKLLDNWNSDKNYTNVFANEIDTLLNSNAKIEKSNLFWVFLYVKSFMYLRNLDDQGNEFSDAKDKPIAFWGSVDKIQADLGLAKQTINKCLEEYVNLKLFRKKEVGSYTVKNKNGDMIQKNVPNIYVMNNQNAKQEINWSMDILKRTYGVDEFGKLKRRRKSVDIK